MAGVGFALPSDFPWTETPIYKGLVLVQQRSRPFWTHIGETTFKGGKKVEWSNDSQGRYTTTITTALSSVAAATTANADFADVSSFSNYDVLLLKDDGTNVSQLVYLTNVDQANEQADLTTLSGDNILDRLDNSEVEIVGRYDAYGSTEEQKVVVQGEDSNWVEQYAFLHKQPRNTLATSYKNGKQTVKDFLAEAALCRMKDQVEWSCFYGIRREPTAITVPGKMGGLKDYCDTSSFAYNSVAGSAKFDAAGLRAWVMYALKQGGLVEGKGTLWCSNAAFQQIYALQAASTTILEWKDKERMFPSLFLAGMEFTVIRTPILDGYFGSAIGTDTPVAFLTTPSHRGHPNLMRARHTSNRFYPVFDYSEEIAVYTRMAEFLSLAVRNPWMHSYFTAEIS